MSNDETNIKSTLAQAMDLIGAQGAELEMLKSALEMAQSIQDEQLEELVRLEEKVSELEQLLHLSDEGLSEALIVLGSMREGLKKVSEATTRTVQSLAEANAAEQAELELTEIAPVVEDDLLDEHERFLKELRDKLTNNKSSHNLG